MNPIKILKNTLPELAKILESMHAYLERQLEVQEKILRLLKKGDDDGKRDVKAEAAELEDQDTA